MKEITPKQQEYYSDKLSKYDGYTVPTIPMTQEQITGSLGDTTPVYLPDTGSNGMTNTEQILKAIHLNWLSKAKTAVIDGSEMTVLPYGFLWSATEEAMKMQRQQILDAVEKRLMHSINCRESYDPTIDSECDCSKRDVIEIIKNL